MYKTAYNVVIPSKDFLAILQSLWILGAGGFSQHGATEVFQLVRWIYQMVIFVEHVVRNGSIARLLAIYEI